MALFLGLPTSAGTRNNNKQQTRLTALIQDYPGELVSET